jgi:hypothetical protein
MERGDELSKGLARVPVRSPFAPDTERSCPRPPDLVSQANDPTPLGHALEHEAHDLNARTPSQPTGLAAPR